MTVIATIGITVLSTQRILALPECRCILKPYLLARLIFYANVFEQLEQSCHTQIHKACIKEVHAVEAIIAQLIQPSVHR